MRSQLIFDERESHVAVSPFAEAHAGTRRHVRLSR